MLVVKIKQTETFKIGDDVQISVLQTKRGHVKIGVTAPKNKKITLPEKTDAPTDRPAV